VERLSEGLRAQVVEPEVGMAALAQVEARGRAVAEATQVLVAVEEARMAVDACP
jgi:hypothetical protein